MQLTDDNFVLQAARHYENTGCIGIREFEDDLNRFKYLKKIFSRYENTGKIPERLVLNHLILLHNVFPQILLPLLFFKIQRRQWSILKTFLVFLNYLPDNYRVADTVLETEIPLDEKLIGILRKI